MEAAKRCLKQADQVRAVHSSARSDKLRVGKVVDLLDQLQTPVETYASKGGAAYDTAVKHLDAALKDAPATCTAVAELAGDTPAKQRLAAITKLDKLDAALATVIGEFTAAARKEPVSVAALAVLEKKEVEAAGFLANGAELVCVQCGGKYSKKQTSKGYCAYHPGLPVRNNSEWSCCKARPTRSDKPDGCMRGEHRAVHHTHYMYNGYLKQWVWPEMRNNASPSWMDLEAVDLADGADKWATAGLRKDGDFYLALGFGGLTKRYWKWSIDELVALGKHLSNKMLPRQSWSLTGEHDDDPELTWCVRATFDVANDTVAGVRVTARTMSAPDLIWESLLPLTSVAPLQHGDVQVIRTQEAKKDVPRDKAYPDLKPVVQTAWFPDWVYDKSPSEQSYDTTAEGHCGLRIKRTAASMLNPVGYDRDRSNDYLLVPVMLLNPTKEDINLIAGMGKLIHPDGTEVHADRIDFEQDSDVQDFPVDIPAKKSVKATIRLTFRCDDGGKQTNGGFFRDRAYLSLHRGGMFDAALGFEDIDEGKAWLRVTPHNSSAKGAFIEKHEDDIFFHYADDVTAFARYAWSVRRDDRKEGLQIRTRNWHRSITAKDLDVAVFGALRSNAKGITGKEIETTGPYKLEYIIDPELEDVVALRGTITSDDKAQISSAYFWWPRCYMPNRAPPADVAKLNKDPVAGKSTAETVPRMPSGSKAKRKNGKGGSTGSRRKHGGKGSTGSRRSRRSKKGKGKQES